MRTFLLFIFSCICYQLSAQTLADSVINKFAQASTPEKIKNYLSVAASIQNKDYVNCIRLCNEVEKLAAQVNDTYSVADAVFLKGLTSYFAGEYDHTLQYYLSAIKKFETANAPFGKAKVLNELGIFYRRQQQDSLALSSFKEAYSIAKSIGEKGVMGTAVNNQGILAQDKGNHTLAIDLFHQAQEIYIEVGDSIGVSYTMDYASVSYAALKNFPLATQLQITSMGIRLRQKDTNAAALSLYSLADYGKLQGNKNQQEKYLLECVAITERIKYKDLTADCYNKLAALYFTQQQFAKAYQFHVKYTTLNEEIFNEKRSKQINELQTKYETEKKQQQIALLTKDNEIKESRTRILLIVFSALLLLILLSTWAYLNFIKSKKQKEIDDAIILEKELRTKSIIEAEEKERIRIARDLHDGVAQTMTAAKMQLEYFMEKNEANHEQNTSLQNAFDLIKDAASEVRAVSHSMVPNALLKSGLVSALRDFVQRIGTEKQQINLVLHGLNDRLNENVETVVFRVLQELVNNIIKHAHATEITIQLIKENTELHIMVEDNGKGFDINQLEEKSGIGLKNITSRVEYLNGTVDFDSTIGKGTTVMIELPLA